MKINQIINIFEDFRDLEKLSPTELIRGGRLDPSDVDNFRQVNGKLFYKIVSTIKQNDIGKGLKSKGLDTLTIYDVTDYQKMKCYIGKNNSSGYAIKPGGELVSVFSSQGPSGDAIVSDAIKNGASHLDCFALRDKDGNISGPLYKLYSRHGFKIDKTKNEGNKGEPYAIVNGVSDYVDENENVHPDDPRVVIFMKR
jgi:hypothetical protein